MRVEDTCECGHPRSAHPLLLPVKAKHVSPCVLCKTCASFTKVRPTTLALDGGNVPQKKDETHPEVVSDKAVGSRHRK